jgi:cytoskeletal protein CcmA (bactofilin family)
VTFTVTVNNSGTELEDLTILSVGLPPGFSYDDGSTTGVTTLEPTETTLGALADDTPDFPLLTWDLTSLGVGPEPGQSVVLSFDAIVSDEDGNFCALAWIGASGGEPSTGSTAQVAIGEADDPCVENLLQITTTVDQQVIANDGLTTYLYTYTTTIKNVGADSQFLTGFREVLPLGFDYKINSTSGVLTTDNPVATLLTDGRWQLDWTFSSPIEIQAGQTKSLVFQAEALVSKGNYSSEGYAFYKGHGVRIHKDSTITGDLVGAVSKVKLDKATNLNGTVRAGGKVDLKKNVVVQNGVIGGDEVKLDKDVVVTGDILSVGDVDLKKDATVNGDVCSDGDVDLHQSASVTGSVSCQPGTLTIVPAGLLVPATMAAGGTDIEIAKNGSQTLAPGAYGELRLKQNATLTLSAGQYAFEKIKVDKNSDIDLDLTNGTITVDVAEDIKFQKSVTMAITSQVGSASDVKFRAQSSIDVHKDNVLLGTFLSLGGKKEAAVTWPSAIVRVMDVFQVSTTNANGEIGSFEAWVGTDSGVINRPIVDR